MTHSYVAGKSVAAHTLAVKWLTCGAGQKGIGTSDDSKFSWEAERLTDFGDEARRPNGT